MSEFTSIHQAEQKIAELENLDVNRKAENIALTKRIAKLKEALTPFAEVESKFNEFYKNVLDTVEIYTEQGIIETSLTYGEFRRAKEVLDE